MVNMEYENIQTSECGRVDLKSKNNHNLSFNVILEKQYDSFNTNNINDLYANGDIEIILGALGTQTIKETTDIKRNNWVIDTNNGVMRITIPYNIPINNSSININQNNIFAIYDTGIGSFIWDSCKYAITKPKLNINQGNIEIFCDNSSPKTFTVINVYNSPGDLSYNWEVGNGWERNGNPVSNFTTTTNTVSLVPTTYPPSNVQVTPVLDGVSFPKLTTTVSLGSFNPSYAIQGENIICNNGVYSVNNLPSGTSVISWSTSDTNIASVNSTGNNQATITKIADGIVTISATLQNSCLQTAPITKDIQIGIPSYINNASITGNEAVCGTQLYTYSVNIPNHPCITNLNWTTSPNIDIVSQNYNTIVVRNNISDTSNAGFIKVKIPNSNIEITKGIMVGLPEISSNSLNITKLGTTTLYSSQWSKLKVNYSTFLYDINLPYNYTYEWNIPNSQVRNFSNPTIREIKPNTYGQLNIGVRVSNQCGCSDWDYTLFNVIYGGANNGFKDLEKI